MERLFGRLDVDNLKLKHGELPTPSVLNRPWLAMANVMGEIDEAVQTVDKGTSLEATKFTKFLTHCNQDGVDLINGVLPVLPDGVLADDVFIDDNFFFGCAYASKQQSNLLKNALREIRRSTGGSSDTSAEEVITNRCNSTLTSLGGWETSYFPEGATHLNVTSNRRGTRIKPPPNGPVTTAGTFKMLTPKFPVTHDTKIAFSGHIKAFKNLNFSGVTITFKMSYLDSSEVPVTCAPQELTINNGVPDGVFGRELLAIPTDAAYARFSIEVAYSLKSDIDIRFKDVMISDTYMVPYTKTERPDAFATYKKLVDFSHPGTLVFWTKFKRSTSESQDSETMAPLYICTESTSKSFQFVRSQSDKPNYTLTGEYADYTTGTAQDSSIKIKLPDSTFDKPVMMAYRWDNAAAWPGGDATKMRMEYLVLDPDDAAIHKTAIEIPYSTITNELHEIRVGYLGDDRISFPYTSPVTEIRYDTEYLNDIQVQTFCLSEQPFTIPFDAALITKILTNEEDDATELANQPNRIANPTGNLSFNGWFGVEPGWSITYGVGGIGFKWALPELTTIPRYLVTMPMPCTSNELLVLSGELRSTRGTVGTYGIGVEFYTDHDVPIRSIEPSLTLTDQQPLKRLSVAFRAPANAAICRAFLMVDSGSKSTKGIYFHRLKLEPGVKPTEYTDEGTPAYSIYF